MHNHECTHSAGNLFHWSLQCMYLSYILPTTSLSKKTSGTFQLPWLETTLFGWSHCYSGLRTSHTERCREPGIKTYILKPRVNMPQFQMVKSEANQWLWWEFQGLSINSSLIAELLNVLYEFLNACFNLDVLTHFSLHKSSVLPNWLISLAFCNLSDPKHSLFGLLNICPLLINAFNALEKFTWYLKQDSFVGTVHCQKSLKMVLK